MTTTAKRQKIRAEELDKLKQNIFNNLPKLSKREIRRYRMPYYQALVLELLEDGFENASYFIDELVIFQRTICENAGADALVCYKPMLKDNKEHLDTLYEKLKSAEASLRKKQKSAGIDKLLELSIYFANEHEDWWWIAEQSFLITIESVKGYYDDGNKRQAMVRYVFGRFLLKQLKDIDRAKVHLQIARDLSHGQIWNASEVLKIRQRNIFKESSDVLHENLLLYAKRLLSTDPKEAIKVCITAEKRAREADNRAGEMECRFFQGICLMEMNDPNTALDKFQKALAMYFSADNKVGICEARIQLALARSRAENVLEAKFHLHQLLEFSEKNDMKYYFALGHRYLGELYLLRNLGSEAHPHLLIAVELFHELDDYINREICKNLAAIAQGQQLSRALMKLINGCDKDNKGSLENVIKLVKWKDSRVEFWGKDKPESEDLNKYLEQIGETDHVMNYYRHEEEEEEEEESLSTESFVNVSLETKTSSERDSISTY